MSNARMPELDALRGIAALAVVIYHLVYRFHEIYGHDGISVYWAYFGHYGVQLFFMLSGFVIYWTLDHVRSSTDFAISRFARLYPVYWAAMIMTFLLSQWLSLPGRIVDIQSFIVNMTMFQEFLGITHVDGVYWTLTLELVFYFWILVLIFFRLSHMASLMLIGLVVANAALVTYGVQIKLLHLLTLNGYGHFFLFGVAVYDLEQNRARKRALLGIALAVVTNIIIGSVFTSTLLIGLMAIFYLAVKGRLPWLNQSIWLWFGGISYALYLVHQNIGYMVMLSMKSWLPAWITIVLAFILVTGVAYLLNRWVEQPITRRLKVRLQQLKSWLGEGFSRMMTRYAEKS